MSYDGWAVLGRGSPWSLWGDPCRWRAAPWSGVRRQRLGTDPAVGLLAGAASPPEGYETLVVADPPQLIRARSAP